MSQMACNLLELRRTPAGQIARSCAQIGLACWAVAHDQSLASNLMANTGLPLESSRSRGNFHTGLNALNLLVELMRQVVVRQLGLANGRRLKDDCMFG